MKITAVQAREIFDSRGQPTIECTIELDNAHTVSAAVAAGLSVGGREAFELRDGGARFGGRGVLKAIEIIHTEIAPLLVGREVNALVMDQDLLDLDGSENLSRLGANSCCAVSMALFRAHAHAQGSELFEFIAEVMDISAVSLPIPLVNIINGGVHADNNLIIQEYLLLPLGALNFRGALEMGITVTAELKKILRSHNKSTLTGDEGGFAAHFEGETEPFDFIIEAIYNAQLGKDYLFALGIDVAASQWYNQKTNTYRWHDAQLTTEDLIKFYQELSENYPLLSIEDGLAEEDWNGWTQLTAQLGNNLQIVGDDVFVTNTEFIGAGIQVQAANAVIIKPGQIGTISQTLQAIALAKNNGWRTIVSHRSGETTDTFIADLAVGASTGQIKIGGCSRGERMAKYNRLLMIEELLQGSS